LLKWNKIGIKNRLFIIFIIIQLLIIALSFYYFSNNHRNFYLEQERISLRHYTNLIIDEIKEDGYNFNSQYLESKVDIWSDNTESRITAVDIDGKVLADSHHDIEKMDNHKNRPEIKSALDSNKASSFIRYSNTIDEDMLYLAQAITIDGQTVGILRSARSLNLIRDVLIDDIKSYLFFFVILALITVYLSWKLTSGIVKPLEKITETAGKISEGDLSQRIPVRKYSSEIENLAKSFNYMASELEGKIKEISQEKNRIETILESMVDGVIATDKDGRITLINPAAQEIFNIDKEQTKGKELISTLFSHRIDMYLERALEKRESISREINYQNPEKKIIQATFIPLIDNKDNVNGGVIVLTDITELRKLETVRNDFVANVSHELRTPLTSILGYLDTLIESDIKDQKIRNKFLRIIKEETDRLSILIKDLLNLSEIESQTIDLKPENFRDVLDKVYNLLADNAYRKNIDIKLDVEDNLPPVYMVKQQIEQVIINLLDNAIKYTPEDGNINIKVIKSDDKIYFSIEDSGIGVPEEEQERIFERFYRVDKARSRSMGGTGIGLSIVRNIIKQHSSEICIESEEGKGSKFTFYLKIAH
jgi:two-component system phosphate regulon sensor histidine kinase PhoR